MGQRQSASAKRNDGRLFHAVVRGDFQVVANELRAGDVDLTLKIRDRSFLHHAGQRGFKRIAELLLKSGFDPNERYGKQQRSLLHFAAATCNFGFASVLLENGAIPNLRTSSGAAPLHFAARTGQSYLAMKLIESGADLNVQDKQGRTPLTLAFNKGHGETAKILTSHGAIHHSRHKVQQQSIVAESNLV